MRQITVDFLKKHKACCPEWEMWDAQKIGDLDKIINVLVENNRITDANWLFTKCSTEEQKSKYCVFVAKKMLYLFQKSKRPHKAIKAVKKYLRKPTKNNKKPIAKAIYAAFYGVPSSDEGLTIDAGVCDEGLILHIVVPSKNIVKEATVDIDIKAKKEIIMYGVQLHKKEKV